MDIGRRQNADPRWLLPLLCRKGHITKGEIGAIRIGAAETLFEIPRAAAGRFAKALANSRLARRKSSAVSAPPPMAAIFSRKAPSGSIAHSPSWSNRRVDISAAAALV